MKFDNYSNDIIYSSQKCISYSDSPECKKVDSATINNFFLELISIVFIIYTLSILKVTSSLIINYKNKYGSNKYLALNIFFINLLSVIFFSIFQNGKYYHFDSFNLLYVYLIELILIFYFLKMPIKKMFLFSVFLNIIFFIFLFIFITIFDYLSEYIPDRTKKDNIYSFLFAIDSILFIFSNIIFITIYKIKERKNIKKQ